MGRGEQKRVRARARSSTTVVLGCGKMKWVRSMSVREVSDTKELVVDGIDYLTGRRCRYSGLVWEGLYGLGGRGGEVSVVGE